MIKKYLVVFAGLITWLLLSPASARAGDCMTDCMGTCWGGGADENRAYCNDTEVQCTSDCRNKPVERSYGAIAYSARNGAYGFSDGWKNQREAEKAAVKYCKQNGSGCKSRVWFYDSCGAVAADGRTVTWGQGASPQAAQQQAFNRCKKGLFRWHCEVKVSHCSR